MPLRKSKLRFAIPLEELVALQKKLCGLFVRWWWTHCCWGNVMWTKFECSVALATEIGISDDSMQLHTPSVYYTVPTGFIWHPWYKCQCQNMVRYDHKTFPYYLLKQKEISNLGIKQCWMNQWLIPLHMTIHFGYKSNLRWCDSMTAFFLGSFFGIRSREEWKQHDVHIETWTNLYSFRKLLSTINMEKYSGNEKNKINYTIAKTAVKSIKRYASNSIYSKRSAKERISHMLIEIIGLHQRQKVGLRVIVHMPIT